MGQVWDLFCGFVFQEDFAQVQELYDYQEEENNLLGKGKG